MKKFYNTPEIDVINFDSEDVITTSGLDNNETESGNIFD